MSQGTRRRPRPRVGGPGVETLLPPQFSHLRSVHLARFTSRHVPPGAVSLPRGQPGRRRTASTVQVSSRAGRLPNPRSATEVPRERGPEPQRGEGAGSVHSQTRARPLPATRRVCKACLPRRRGAVGRIIQSHSTCLEQNSVSQIVLNS